MSKILNTKVLTQEDVTVTGYFNERDSGQRTAALFLDSGPDTISIGFIKDYETEKFIQLLQEICDWLDGSDVDFD